MLSYREAKEELSKYFQTKWVDGCTNGLLNSDPPLQPLSFTVRGDSYIPKVYYRNIHDIDALPNGEHFCKFTMSNLKTTQAAMPGGRQHGVGVRHRTPGVGTVQLFFSKHNYTSAEETLLTAIAHEMFLATSVKGISFNNSTIKELPEEEKYYRTNVSFEYCFDTLVKPTN